MLFMGYLLLGAFAGMLAGLFGIGGGLIIVPVLVMTFHAQGVDCPQELSGDRRSHRFPGEEVKKARWFPCYALTTSRLDMAPLVPVSTFWR